jgi:hypothetical protein
MQFGSDGCMWITTGDGGGGNDAHNNAQNSGTLLGKILRIDPEPPGAGGPGCAGTGTGSQPTPTYDLTVPVVSARHRAASGSCGGVP